MVKITVEMSAATFISAVLIVTAAIITAIR